MKSSQRGEGVGEYSIMQMVSTDRLRELRKRGRGVKQSQKLCGRHMYTAPYAYLEGWED